MRDIHLPGRSAAVATSQPLATFAGMEILRRGGNTVDAAIAACAVQRVVEPMGTGIGGDCFAICCLDGGGRKVAINGSGRAPSALTCDALSRNGDKRIAPDSATGSRRRRCRSAARKRSPLIGQAVRWLQHRTHVKMAWRCAAEWHGVDERERDD